MSLRRGAQQSAEVIGAQPPSGCRGKDRTGRTRQRDDRLDRARPVPGNGATAAGHRPSLEREFSRFPSCLNRRVRTRRLGGVGRAVSDDCPYPIGQQGCLLRIILLRLSQHSIPVSVRAKKTLAIEVNHVVGSICYPNFRLPCDLPKVFQKTSTTEKSSYEYQAHLATGKQGP